MNDRFLSILVLAFMLTTTANAAPAANHVNGNLILFNDNGAWCWFQDPRAIYDPVNDSLLIGSIAVSEGLNGDSRGGDVDLVTYKFATGSRDRFVLRHKLLTEDDHNAPALLIRPDGRYFAMYSKHNQEGLSYWRISENPHDSSAWRPEMAFDWNTFLEAAGADNHVTYHNVFYLKAENRTYDFTRAVNLDPSILLSTDQGNSWAFSGKLFTEPRVGYVNGYTKYAGNGVDRIDFITTEHHPRDFNNSVYHGYLQGGKLHRSDGTVIDDNIIGGAGKSQTNLTKIFAASSLFNGETMTHAWTADLQLDQAGRPCAILTARAHDEPENTNFEDHRFFYARNNGTSWKVTHLAKAGPRLWESEQDYTGLGAIDPADSNIVYISTPIDPRTDKAMPKHEIFKGVTSDDGASWTWTAVTENSSVDNLRPVVVPCGAGRTAVLWFRGSMWRSQHYDCAMVGVIDLNDRPVTFVPADSAAAAPQAGAPTTREVAQSQSLKIPAGDTDLFVYFRADSSKDPGIRAGLSAENRLTYRAVSCQQAEQDLYRGYLGRVSVKQDQTVKIFVDGESGKFAGCGYATVGKD